MPRRLVSFKEKFAERLATAALIASAFGALPAAANPSGGTVQAGQVNITNVGPNTLHIEQLTQKAIIDWQKFGIGAGESVRFLQPSQLSVILNRVVGQDPTQILGNMSANGNVFLINPNGVLFGPSAVVNVGGLVASTLNISNDDFLNGNYRFTQDANKALASVINQGSITITDGGYAVLMAPLVSNEGLIVANLGKVNLMSGESATLNFDGRNLINYSIGHFDSATPGTVVVDRQTVSDLLAGVIKDQTLNEAGGLIENADGTVSLVGAADTVVNHGTIQANGADGQEAGKVVLESGRLTVVGKDSVVEASGKGEASDGGDILALSQGTFKLSEGARLEAKGSDEGGDGGFIETSGHEHIILEDYVDASAVDGENGKWLIDPDFLTIISGSGGTLDTVSDPFDTTNGNASDTVSEEFLEILPGGTDVTLQANTQITISDLADDLLSFADDVSVTFQTTTGDIVFTDPNDTVRVGGTGSLTMDSGGSITLGKLVAGGTANIDLRATGDITAVVDGSEDIGGFFGLATIRTGGNFQGDVAQNIALVDIGGDATLGVSSGANLNYDMAGTVAGDLTIVNSGSVSLGSGGGSLSVVGDAAITNSLIVADDDDGVVTLTAANLTITHNGSGAVTKLETQISGTATLNDLLSDGGGSGLVVVENDGSLNSVIVRSDDSNVTVSTDLTGSSNFQINSGVITASSPAIGTVDIQESAGDITVGLADFSNALTANVSISATAGEISGPSLLETMGDASITANGDIFLASAVAGTLSLTSQSGEIALGDSYAGGPSGININTVSGKSVYAQWDLLSASSDISSALIYDSDTGYFGLLDLEGSNSNVTFQTGVGNIVVEFADVGDCSAGDLNSLTLIATTGDILDGGDPGSFASSYGTGVTDEDLDIRGNVVNLVAGGSIGTSTDALEIDACDSITSSSGGDTYLDVISTGTVGYGGTAGGDIELTTAGDLTVDESILAGGDIHLDVNGDITLI